MATAKAMVEPVVTTFVPDTRPRTQAGSADGSAVHDGEGTSGGAEPTGKNSVTALAAGDGGSAGQEDATDDVVAGLFVEAFERQRQRHEQALAMTQQLHAAQLDDLRRKLQRVGFGARRPATAPTNTGKGTVTGPCDNCAQLQCLVDQARADREAALDRTNQALHQAEETVTTAGQRESQALAAAEAAEDRARDAEEAVSRLLEHQQQAQQVLARLADQHRQLTSVHEASVQAKEGLATQLAEAQQQVEGLADVRQALEHQRLEHEAAQKGMRDRALAQDERYERQIDALSKQVHALKKQLVETERERDSTRQDLAYCRAQLQLYGQGAVGSVSSPGRTGQAVSYSANDADVSHGTPSKYRVNDESDFNIFTGEPRIDVNGRYSEQHRRNRLTPETRFAWKESPSGPSSTQSQNHRRYNTETLSPPSQQMQGLDFAIGEALTQARSVRGGAGQDVGSWHPHATSYDHQPYHAARASHVMPAAM
eukprot:m.234398 g.234398  ORF g.234398 m.234398 type:complete len:483 (-) comp18915_c0_seq15:2140-3588(-)